MEENSFLTYSKDVLQGKVQEFAFTSGQVYSTIIVHKKIQIKTTKNWQHMPKSVLREAFVTGKMKKGFLYNSSRILLEQKARRQEESFCMRKIRA